MRKYRKLFVVLIIVALAIPVYAQTLMGTKLDFVHPTLGVNDDATSFFRVDPTNDFTSLRLMLGDEWSSNFSIGYNYYYDGQWVSNFNLDGNGNGYFRGNLGIGTTSPSSKVDISIGTTSTITTGLSVYHNGDPNLGIKVLTGAGDGANYLTWNGGLGSWNGIGFHSTIDGVTRGVFNVRTGDFSLKGNVYSEGVGINYFNSNVGIGTSAPGSFKLAVEGKIYGKEVQVALANPGPDYVFDEDYKLTPLEEIKSYIDQNKHLPEVPSAKEMEKHGIQLGEMNMLLLKKIEELTLYQIQAQQTIEKLSQRVHTLETKTKNEK